MVALLGTEIRAQEIVDWSDLSAGIYWESNTDITLFRKATFSSELTDLEGKKIIIVGYFLSLEGMNSVYLLSKNPMASCFFCGNGGPETIMELHFTEKPSFVTDDLLSVSGILRLNRSNPNHCYYRIEEAEALSL